MVDLFGESIWRDGNMDHMHEVDEIRFEYCMRSRDRVRRVCEAWDPESEVGV
jgi:hypothetical protein